MSDAVDTVDTVDNREIFNNSDTDSNSNLDINTKSDTSEELSINFVPNKHSSKIIKPITGIMFNLATSSNLDDSSEKSISELSISELSISCASPKVNSDTSSTDSCECCQTQSYYIYDDLYGIFEISKIIKHLLFDKNIIRLKNVLYMGCYRFQNKTFSVYEHIIGALYFCIIICKKLDINEQTLLCIQLATILKYFCYFPFEEVTMYILENSYTDRFINLIDEIIPKYIYNLLNSDDIELIKKIINRDYNYSNIDVFELDLFIRNTHKSETRTHIKYITELINKSEASNTLKMSGSYYNYLVNKINTINYEYDESFQITEFKSKLLELFKELNTTHNFKRYHKYKLTQMTDDKILNILLNTKYKNIEIFKNLFE